MVVNEWSDQTDDAPPIRNRSALSSSHRPGGWPPPVPSRPGQRLRVDSCDEYLARVVWTPGPRRGSHRGCRGASDGGHDGGQQSVVAYWKRARSAGGRRLWQGGYGVGDGKLCREPSG